MTTPEHVGTKTVHDVRILAEACRNWGRWGADDELGTLNFVTPDKVAEATRLATTGKVVSLSLEFGSGGPQTGRLGRHNPQHFMLRTGADNLADTHGRVVVAYADDALLLPLQSATQWDALSHVFYEGRMWNGFEMTLVGGAGAARNSIVAAASKTIGRGVLLDVARTRGVDALAVDHVIGVDDLTQAEAMAGVRIGSGDFVLIRTGWLERARSNSWTGYVGGPSPGVGIETLEWFFDREVAAVASDTAAVEVRPSETAEIFLPWHEVAIPNMGLTVGEMFDLGELSSVCSTTDRYSFLLAAPGLPVTGGVGTPTNPLAVF